MKMRRGKTEIVYDLLVAIRDFPQKATMGKIAIANLNYAFGYQLVMTLKEKGLITYERPKRKFLNLRLTDEGIIFVRSAKPIIEVCAEVIQK